MRTILILAMFTASLAYGARTDYQQVRELDLDANGLGKLEIDAGAGGLSIEGVDGADRVRVTATIEVPGTDEKDALKVIERSLVLVLVRDGDTAVLKGYFEDSGWSWNDSPRVQLEVQVPKRFALYVDDGSGSLTVHNVSGDIRIDDGSGLIEMRDVGGAVDIEDGSGSIDVQGVGGDLSIDDGSGSIDVAGVNGSVIVDDGSGSISVKDVRGDLTIVDDGSGSINFSEIQGRVEDRS